MKSYKIHILLIFLTGIIFTSFTSDKPSSNSNHFLFKIDRSKDANEIIYEINLTSSGELDIHNPVNVYWIKHTHGHITKPLTWVQKKFAYGLRYISINEEEVNFQFISYGKRDFAIRKNAKGDYRVYTDSKNKEVELNRIFIQLDGGTFWFPNVTQVELYSNEVISCKSSIEIIKP